MAEYVVDLSTVTDWPGLVAAFNEGLIRPAGGEWNGNLNAFHDYLSWPAAPEYRLILRGWGSAETAIAGDMTDRRPTLDLICEIFTDNPHVHVSRE
jgi:hypothetical protein